MERWDLVGQHVRTRLLELGWRHGHVEQAASLLGLSKVTARPYWTGDPPKRPPAATTISTVEAALNWPHGTISRLLDGDDHTPKVAEPPSELDVVLAELAQVNRQLAVRQQREAQLVARMDQLAAEVARLTEQADRNEP